jgi:hypothetical protein
MPKFVMKQSSNLDVTAELSNIVKPVDSSKESNEITISQGTFKILSDMKSDEINDDVGPDEHYRMMNK